MGTKHREGFDSGGGGELLPPEPKNVLLIPGALPELGRANRLIFHCEDLNEAPPGPLNQCHCQQCLGFYDYFTHSHQL